jgi:hypothetical protein
LILMGFPIRVMTVEPGSKHWIGGGKTVIANI